MRVLIVDDDRLTRSILTGLLKRLGHETTAAADGLAAVEMLKEAPAEVIISDWMMPGMNGVDLCRWVRSDEYSSGYAYFILLTSLDDTAHYLEGMKAGADDYLRKPPDFDELQARFIAAARVTKLHGELRGQRAQLEALNARLHEESRRDALTGVANRLSMQEDLLALHARASRYGHKCCVALADIDHFKRFNDTYGHGAGDDVLRRVAQTMAATCRSGDKVYRYGGEEFLAILPGQSLEGAVAGMERVRRAVEKLAIPNGDGLVTISTGIAPLPGDDGTVDEAVKWADKALYGAKSGGRNRVAVYAADALSVLEPAGDARRRATPD